MKKLSNILEEAFSQWDNAPAAKSKVTSIPTGISHIDKKLGGLPLCSLTTIASRPGMGKTSLISTLIYNQAVQNHYCVALFTLESHPAEVIKRLLSIDSGIEKSKIGRGELDGKERETINSSIGRITESKIYIDDSFYPTIEEMAEVTRTMVQENRVKVVYIDYLQLIGVKEMPYKSYTRHDELALIVRKLKLLANELSIAIVLVSQLNRNYLGREDGRTQPIFPKLELTDLRESGAIEDNSDMVWLLSRPRTNAPQDEEGNDIRNRALLGIAKNRYGGTFTIDLKCDMSIGKLYDWPVDYLY